LIVIIDYGVGNLGNIHRAIKFLDIQVKLSKKIDDIKSAAGIILPGVGAFGEGMKNLEERNLVGPIKEAVLKDRKPFLGICLGLQLLFSESEEDPDSEGLNLIRGKVKKFAPQKVTKIPHMGWNYINLLKDDILLKGINMPDYFYFVHSYYTEPFEDVGLGKTVYDNMKFTSFIRKDNIWGIQAHPEKSSVTGLHFLKNFSEVVNNASNSSS